MKAPCKRTQGIVGQQLPTLLEVTCCVGLHTLLHVVVCCWAVVKQSLKPVKLLALFKRMQHFWPAPSSIVVNCCVCLHVALSMLRHNESYCGSDSFTLNQKDILIFLKNLLSTKRTVSVDTILYHKLFRSFLPFFLSSALLCLI